MPLFGLSRDIDEELESHIQEAIEQGHDSALRQREQSYDTRLIP